MQRTLTITLLAACAGFPLHAQHGEFKPEVKAASDEGKNALKGFKAAKGMTVDLVAGEPALANAVAFTIDNQGRFFVVETHRLATGVFDTRRYRHWLADDLACKSVADRIALHQKHMKADLPKWKAYHERIMLLTDEDGDGVVDRSQVYADGFNDLADGIAAGVLVNGDDVWFTCIPKLWRLRDKDGDGKADERTAVQGGYGVHVSLIGHDMHGLRIGPDRRLYFSIGDRGVHIEHEGKTHHYPNEGLVLRCELDGSKLEVIHRGLRNPQELAFDAFGNLFTGDNNSDLGDRARWVYVAEGGHAGWSIGFQWLGSRGAWHRDKLWHLEHRDHPAYVLPPIAHIGSGPSGLAYYPGTGLPKRYDDCFFMCDFRGTARPSNITAIRVQPKGAGFELVNAEPFLQHVCATDVEFGIDGGLYLTDWISGWGKTGKGRIYRSHDPKLANDPLIAETRELLKSGMKGRPITQLATLLHHQDQRIRQAAQFALVDRSAADQTDNKTALAALIAATKNVDELMGRVHAIWALGILGRHDNKQLAAVRPLLNDSDARIRTQAARVLADGKDKASYKAFLKHLSDDNAQVRYHCALGLGKLGDTKAVPALLEFLAQNEGRDKFLRHAGATALWWIGDIAALTKTAAHKSRAVRMGAILAMRRIKAPEIACFLDDNDPTLVLEAARAIYDADISAALPALAALSTRKEISNENLLRRVLSAHRKLGTSANTQALAAFALRDDVPDSMRCEALQILAEWKEPSWQDRVHGNHHLPPRDTNESFAGLDNCLTNLLQSASDTVRVEASKTTGSLKRRACAPGLRKLVTDTLRKGRARAAALRALASIDANDLATVAATVSPKDPVELRSAAVSILAQRNPAKAVPVLDSLIANASQREKQNAVSTLAKIQTPEADAVLLRWFKAQRPGKAFKAIELELEEAMSTRESKTMRDAYAADTQVLKAKGGIEPYRATLHGGNKALGQKIFLENTSAMCIRCHMLWGNGGNAGPKLDGIGKRQKRPFLLESLTHPGAAIAEGFGNVVVTKKDGEIVAGFQKTSNDKGIDLVDAAGKSIHIARPLIAKQSKPISAMPPMGLILTRREVRDLIQFLSTLR